MVAPITKRKDSGNKQQVIESEEGIREYDLKNCNECDCPYQRNILF